MEFVPKALRIIGRTSLVVFAIILLSTISPHQQQWNVPRLFQGFLRAAPMKLIEVPILHHAVSLLEFQIFVFLILLIFATALFSPAARRALGAIFSRQTAANAVLLSFGAFLFTLLPSPFFPSTINYWGVVFYHALQSFSMMLFLVGIHPLVNELSRWRFGRRIMIFTWEKMKFFFLNVKPVVFLGALFIIVFTLTNLASYFLFEHIPHIVDSIAQVFHGKIFAGGKLTVPSHPQREFFNLDLSFGISTIINNGRWYSQYPPGHSFMLMLGILVGAPWIVNPFLGSMTVLMLYFLGTEMYDQATARLSVVLGALSPFLVFMSSEFMNHASSLFFFTAFLLFFAKTVRSRRIRYAVAAGASLGMVLNVRPLTAVGLAIPFCIYGAYLLVTRFRDFRLPVTGMVITFLIFAGILLGFNLLTNGDPLLFGYEVLHGPAHRPGFGHAAWGAPHTPITGLYKTLNNLNGVNIFLFEWPVPSLIFVFLLFVSLTRNRWDYLLLAAFLSLTVAHFFYWYQDWCFGPRFLYESAAALIVLTARGILRIPELIRNVFDLSPSIRRVQVVTAVYIAACLFIAAFVNIPPLIKQYGTNFSGVNAEVLQAVKKGGITKAIIFTRSYYGSVFAGNSPLLDGDVIYAKDLGEKNHLLMAAYPGYKYYLADGKNIQLLEPK